LRQNARRHDLSLVLAFCVSFSDTNVNNSEILERRSEESITMTIEKMTREFRYDGLRLADPNERLSVDEVKIAYSATYPEITTAVGH
jgi:Prokaryotic Ubiquitin